jgi:hypothetical protein
MSTLVRFSLLFALVASPAFAAQPGQNSHEANQNQKQRVDNKQEKLNDRMDVQQLESLLGRFEQARSSKNFAALDAIDDELKVHMQAELAESQKDRNEDAHELDSSHQEKRSDRRELGRDAVAPGESGRDVHNLRDDRRDKRDDQADLATRDKLLAERQAISKELTILYRSHTAEALNRKHTLITELIRLGRQEQAENREEKREDRTERSEDRRERRDDRHGRQ